MIGWVRLLSSAMARLAKGMMLAVSLALLAAAAHAQVGTDRRGGDYANAPVRSGDPAVCAQRCERDARCRAWSFAYPGTVGPRAMCWLKAEVPARTEDDCCVSGVRGGGVIEPRTGPIEYGIDRWGGDYRSFETKERPDGNACAKACEDDKRCRAWTYVRAGYQSPTARCYLKSRVTRPRPKPCCISGAVR